MSFNNGYEKKKFNYQWEKEKKFLIEAGMDEKSIDTLYEYDKAFFNSRRRYEERWIEETSLECFSIEEDFHQNLNFMEQISDRNLYLALKKLKDHEIELFKLYAFDNMNINEIAKLHGKSKSTISEKITRIKKK